MYVSVDTNKNDEIVVKFILVLGFEPFNTYSAVFSGGAGGARAPPEF